MSVPTILVLAMLLDAALGEPKWLWSRVPHLAVLMGRAVGWADQMLNQGNARQLKGALTMAALAVVAVTLGAVTEALPLALVDVAIVAILLAHNSLVSHVRSVAMGLSMSVPEGRRAVARIVGRDVSDMDGSAVARAAIESAAENLSDGVTAPVLFYLIFGLPGLLLYKVTNTADSMIGYKTDRYRNFGRAAARFDDLLNWVPARLTAFILAAITSRIGDWPAIRQDAALHRSPNAGWPEAAMARALGVALAGPRSYDGHCRDFPFVNATGRLTAGPEDITGAVTRMWEVWGVLLVVCLVLAAFA